MYKLVFPTRDTTLYERHPNRNTGVDQILELSKITSGSAIDDLVGQFEYWASNFNTRILMDFNISEISQSIVDNGVSNPEFYLTIKAANSTHLPIEYTVYAYPISGSWTNGTGYYDNNFEVTNGASWTYRDSLGSGLVWVSAGGDFYTGSAYECSQSFNYESPDIRMDVTKIVRLWLSGSIPQNGFMIKRSDTSETDSSVLGGISFFSKDTHTIYVPRLEAYWDNVDVSGTGSISALGNTDYVIYIKNLRESYRETEITKLRVGVRDRFPTASYSTTSNYLTLNRLPDASYFQIMDSVTDEIIVPFHDPGTKVSCDSNGNYIVLDMDTFLPERFYRIIFKVTSSDGSTTDYTDENFVFKVYRI